MVSLLAFAVVVGAGVRNLRVWDSWNTPRLNIGLYRGCACYSQSAKAEQGACFKHYSGRIPQNAAIALKFESFSSAQTRQFGIRIPLWFPLVLLLIVPLYWVMALPVSSRAFLVVTTRVQQ